MRRLSLLFAVLASFSNPPLARSAQAPDTFEFRITVGLTDRYSRMWEGAVTVSGGDLAGVEGYLFSQNDVARPNGKFEFRTKVLAGGGRVNHQGLTVRVRGAESTRVAFRTRAAAFEFAAADVPADRPLTVMGGNGRVERVAMHAGSAAVLSNSLIRATFDSRGLISIEDLTASSRFGFARDGFAITLDGVTYSSDSLAPSRLEQGPVRVAYRYAGGPYGIEVVYELAAAWRFVSKQILVHPPAGRTFRVDDVEVFRSALSSAPAQSYIIDRTNKQRQTQHYGAFLRFGGARGLMAVVQNPFLRFERDGAGFSLRYSPAMPWKAEYGPFPSDRGCLGPYTLTGRTVPEKMIPEWHLPAESPAAVPGMDEAEIAAFTECVRAFLINPPSRPLRLFVGWCVNDYQIDAGTPAGRAEYKRIIDRAAELGAEHVLYAPANSQLSRREDSTDDWSWEYVLWLGLGQKIRKGEWDPKSGAIPPSVQEMLDYARSRNVKLVAYVYPVLPFTQNPEWLVEGSPFHQKKRNASLGVRAWQDWLIENLLAFRKRTGLGGFAFDYTFLWYDGTSRYAQWFGWRRVLETLRREAPELAIDGRQLYQHYGPWSWLGGSYPHPTSTDEQPESFVPFPDLHLDRVSANRQRYTAWWYRNHEFCPPELMPGFITHQTPRMRDLPGTTRAELHKDRQRQSGEFVPGPLRLRDWDYLGWRYSLISSIATAGWNHVIDMIPARDEQEFRHFSDTDKRFFQGWLDWAERNREYLRRTRTILAQPAIGRVDGTSAINGDRGFLFLFNPNGRRLDGEFRLDASIGLDKPGAYVLKEVYPLEGRLVGRIWKSGDPVKLSLDGASATVLAVEPAPGRIGAPLVFGVPGESRVANGEVMVTGARGEAGSGLEVHVLLPTGAQADRLRVNGVVIPCRRQGDLLTARLRFAGEYFTRSAELKLFGGKGELRIPARVFRQLADRRKAWPIEWSAEDRYSTWLAPERLLVHVRTAQPDDQSEPVLRVDGKPFPLERSYASARVHAPSFVGFYADLSRLRPGRTYRVELDLPAADQARFEGLFFDNVETEFTDRVAR